jgi:hypothetical protein
MTSAFDRSAQLICETLDTVVTPSARDAILADALRECSLDVMPSDPDELRMFVDGPLCDALVRGLGPELAVSVLEELSRFTRLSSDTPPASGRGGRRSSRPASPRSTPPRRNTPAIRMAAVRRTPTSTQTPSIPPDVPTIMPPPKMSRHALPRVGSTPPTSGTLARTPGPWGSDEYPSGEVPVGLSSMTEATRASAHVLVASIDALLLQRLTPWLDATAELMQVVSVRELVRDLEVLADSRVVLLVDCRRPSVRPTAIAALADELPTTVSVVLWGPNDEQERAILAVSPAVRRWITVQADVRPKELAFRCAELVG